MKKLLVLQKIIEVGSFTKAASLLGYTQSSLSQIIASLEDEFSIKLLKRSRSGVSLTPEGKKLYPYIQRSIQQYQATYEMAKEIKGLQTGVVSIGAVASISRHWLPNLIKEFQTQYPDIHFVLRQGDYDLIREWIKIGKVDFGFLTPAISQDLKTVPVKKGSMVVVASLKNSLAKKNLISIKELTKDPFILLEEGSYSEPLNAFKKVNSIPNIKYRIHDDNTIMTMVEADLGISILSKLVLTRTNFNIACLETEPQIERTISIAYRDKLSLPIASKHFIDFLLSKKDQLD
ncbi:LysR family transcriptional regulator [Liquorilactobacillus uvarum]|uniref:LysR family transcriptional regulator n=1 Tax=Liquorilactobacillus uvarum TaxID=303240 RepID=UPI00288C28A4|nr:LysR family transcriptional regulator [Liquorilactobacillus uvarum]